MSGIRAGLVRLDDLDFHPFNAGRDLGDLRPLAASIARRGLIHPVSVERNGNRLRIRAGHRRAVAARLAGLTRVPAIIHPEPLADAEWLTQMVEENALRKDLDPAERRAFIARLRSLGVGWQAVAAAFGVSVATARTWQSEEESESDAEPERRPRPRAATKAPSVVALKRVELLIERFATDPHATRGDILAALSELVSEARAPKPRREPAYRLRKGADVVEDVEVLVGDGQTWDAALARLGMKHDALERTLARQGRGDLISRLKGAAT